MRKQKYYDIWNPIIKGSIAVILIYALYQQLFAKDHLAEMGEAFLQHIRSANQLWLILTIVLLPINWVLETLKWQSLFRSGANLKFPLAFRAVLSGVTFSIFTPNRLGEYAGRMLVLEKEHHWLTLFSTFLGGLCQLLIIVIIGIPAIFHFANDYWLWTSYQLESAVYWGSVFTLLVLIGLFNLKRILGWVTTIQWIKKQGRIQRLLQRLQNFNTYRLFQALAFAFLRYLVYTLQYFFILKFFDIQVDVWNAVAGIATIFLIQTSLPFPPFISLLARGELAILVWGNFEPNDIIILAATFGLFIINLSVPALLGTIVIVRTNVLKSLGYDKKNK